MKKIICAVLAGCAVLVCGIFTACGVPQKDYDGLENKYNEVLAEKSWLDLYKSIEMEKSYEEISQKFGFTYTQKTSGSGEDSYTMEAYIWENKNLFDAYHTEENRIVVVFRDNKAIYKQYGNANFIMDGYEGTVIFPSHKLN